MRYERISDPAGVAAELICKGNYLLWFQGRMEYGPRALGNRSILAPAWSEDVKKKLNLEIKRRSWYQPFAPSMLVEDAQRFLEDYDGIPDRFMTMGYMVKTDAKKIIPAVIHVDGSTRPQMVEEENELYEKLLQGVKKKLGYGIILNTSFNLHGEPIVCSPSDAIDTMKRSGAKYLIIGEFLVEKK